MRRRFILGLLGVCWTVASAGAAETTKRLNVIMISVDTVRPDHLSCYGYRRRTTPNIDAIARDGVIFTQAFSQAITTIPSHLSIFTSRYPTTQWVFWEGADLDPSTTALTEILHREGYATASFAGFFPDHVAHRRLLESRVFQAFDHTVNSITLKELPRELYEWLTAHRDEPFFLFVHGFDAHQPHVLPIQYDAKRFNPTYHGRVPSTPGQVDRRVASSLGMDLEQARRHEEYGRIQRDIAVEQFLTPDGFRPEDLEHLRALYDAQLYYLDQGLGGLFQALKNLGLLEQTLLVIFSDHGQALGEHDVYADHQEVHDEVTRTVLIIRDPRMNGHRQVDQIVRGIDIMPTILERLNLPIPDSVQGRSLIPLMRTGQDPGREEIAVTVEKGMRAIRTPTWKLITALGSLEELYDLRTDPNELRNRIQDDPDIAVQLLHRLDEIVPAEVARPVVDQEQGPVVINEEQWREEHSYW